MLDISILTIGDEICIGQIVNTNSSWIASQCTKLGANVKYHSSIHDDKIDMLSEIKRLSSQTDLLIITGGLGPTHDDITKPVLTEYFNDKLEVHQETLKYLQGFFKKKGRELAGMNEGQALVPTKAKPLFNRVGTAPGLLFEENNKYFVALPGVPSEMKAIMTDSVFTLIKDLIKHRNEDVLVFKTLQVAGIVESDLASLIGDPYQFLDGGTLAFLPSYKGIRLRIGVKATSFDIAQDKIKKIEDIIRSKAGEYIYGVGDDSIISKIAEILIANKQTVSVAESCTAGLLGAEFTSISGSSAYFSGGVLAYSNEIKGKILGVNKNTLLNYGAVSEECAKELAMNVRKKFDTEFGISITGIAGPTGGSQDKPVGTVWIGLSDNEETIAKKYVFGNDRVVNRERSVGAALSLLLKKLLSK